MPANFDPFQKLEDVLLEQLSRQIVVVHAMFDVELLLLEMIGF
jgi:hypothetical protein